MLFIHIIAEAIARLTPSGSKSRARWNKAFGIHDPAEEARRLAIDIHAMRRDIAKHVGE